MKKKIKDLTLEDIFYMCLAKKCEKCPFGELVDCPRSQIRYLEHCKDFEKEVEVDE